MQRPNLVSIILPTFNNAIDTADETLEDVHHDDHIALDRNAQYDALSVLTSSDSDIFI